MGCSSGTSAAPYATDSMRWRLSIGSIDAEGVDKSLPVSDSDVCAEDRALLLQLNEEDVFQYIRMDVSEARRFSVGTETDQVSAPGFSDKSTSSAGTAYDVKEHGIGYACKKGLKPESPNQDSFLVLRVGHDYCLYAVFDGHGRHGHDVSNFVKDNFPKMLFSQETFREDPHAAIACAFQKTQYLIEKATFMKQIDASRSGSTASIVLHDLKQNTLYIAHVGDSRVVLARETPLRNGKKNLVAKNLTIDHKPDLPEEKSRIERAGGVVVHDGGWNHRVYARKKDKTGRSYPGLNMSRSMGDLQGYRDAGISCTPDISQRAISYGSSITNSFDTSATHVDTETATDKFLLLCSDGVWEFLSSEQAVHLADQFSRLDAHAAAEELSATAWNLWMQATDGEMVDDITALVIHLQDIPQLDSDNPEPESPQSASMPSEPDMEVVKALSEAQSLFPEEHMQQLLSLSRMEPEAQNSLRSEPPLPKQRKRIVWL